MWNKKDEMGMPQSEPYRGNAPPPVAPPVQHNGQSAVRAMPLPATIGPSVHIKGDVRTREEVTVDGEVEGTLESDNLLTVGPSGKVRANVKARELVIYGSLKGDVEVSGKIAIREQGSLIGNIKSAGISIDDGAYFKGSIDIVRSEPAPPTKLAPVEPKIVAPIS